MGIGRAALDESLDFARDHDLRFRIMDSVLEVNEATKRRMLDKVRTSLGDLEGRTVAVLGLSSVIAPDGILVSQDALRSDIPIMIVVSFACLPIFFTGWKISRG